MSAALALAIALPALAELPAPVLLADRPDMILLPALDETGCRAPRLIWRCRAEGVEVIYAFDMEIAEGTQPEIEVRIDGRSLALAGEWPLSTARRNASVPDPAGFTAAALGGSEVLFRLADAASGAELADRFALAGLEAQLAGLKCGPVD
jgi:hypothetical protein